MKPGLSASRLRWVNLHLWLPLIVLKRYFLRRSSAFSTPSVTFLLDYVMLWMPCDVFDVPMALVPACIFAVVVADLVSIGGMPLRSSEVLMLISLDNWTTWPTQSLVSQGCMLISTDLMLWVASCRADQLAWLWPMSVLVLLGRRAPRFISQCVVWPCFEFGEGALELLVVMRLHPLAKWLIENQMVRLTVCIYLLILLVRGIEMWWNGRFVAAVTSGCLWQSLTVFIGLNALVADFVPEMVRRGVRSLSFQPVCKFIIFTDKLVDFWLYQTVLVVEHPYMVFKGFSLCKQVQVVIISSEVNASQFFNLCLKILNDFLFLVDGISQLSVVITNLSGLLLDHKSLIFELIYLHVLRLKLFLNLFFFSL